MRASITRKTPAACAGPTAHRAPAVLAAVAVIAVLVLAGVALAACSGASTATDAPTATGAAGGVVQDLAYDADSPAQKLDLYLPARGEAPYPVIVAIHGGGFLSGDKADGQIEPVLAALKRGYAVAGLNYRLSQEAPFPAAISDVKAAIRWLRAHAADYGLDPERFAAWGQSAGGTLAALAGTSGGVAALAGPDPQNADQSDRLQAVVDWYGPISFLRTDEDFRAAGFPGTKAERAQSFLSQYMGAPLREVSAKVRAADPITYITPDDPPVLVEHGTADATVPVGQSRRFAAALARVLGPEAVTLRIFPGAGHVDPLFFEQKHIDGMLDWLDAKLW